MNRFFLFLIAFFLVIFQVSFLSHFPIFSWIHFLPGYISGWTINVVLIFAFWLLVFRDFKKSLFFAFFSGLFLDFLSVNAFGSGLLSIIISLFLMNLLFVFSKLPSRIRFFVFLPVILIIFEILKLFFSWLIFAVIK